MPPGFTLMPRLVASQTVAIDRVTTPERRRTNHASRVPILYVRFVRKRARLQGQPPAVTISIMLSPHTVVPAATPVARAATAVAQLPYPVCAPEVLTVDVRAVTVGVNDGRCAVTECADRANHREAVIPAAHVDDGRFVQVAH